MLILETNKLPAHKTHQGKKVLKRIAIILIFIYNKEIMTKLSIIWLIKTYKYMLYMFFFVIKKYVCDREKKSAYHMIWVFVVESRLDNGVCLSTHHLRRVVIYLFINLFLSVGWCCLNMFRPHGSYLI